MDNLIIDNNGGSISNLVEDRGNMSTDLWKNLELKESMIRLESRQTWLKDEDQNNHFFHSTLKDIYMRKHCQFGEDS